MKYIKQFFYLSLFLAVTALCSFSSRTTAVYAQAANESLTEETLDKLNPLIIGIDANSELSNSEELKETFSTPGGVISRALTFAFPLAGLILFIMFLWSGFEILSGGSSKAVDAGKQRATAAVVGFILLFVSYWVIQLVEVITGAQIL